MVAGDCPIATPLELRRSAAPTGTTAELSRQIRPTPDWIHQVRALSPRGTKRFAARRLEVRKWLSSQKRNKAH